MVIRKKEPEECYECEICKFIYGDKELAERCERWCKKNKSCNLNIIKHSIKK